MRKTAKSQSLTRAEDRSSWHLMSLGMGLFVGAALVVSVAKAESHEEVIVTHGISTFGNLVYSDPDFPNLNYVNVDAPKGGVLSMWFQGGFDNLNPFATKAGRPAVGSSMQFEALLTGTLDDVDGAYCYICTTMEFPASKDWVVFNMLDNVTFSDGSPLTAHDVAFSHDLMITQGTESYRDSVSQMVTGTEVIDDYTIKFTFADGYPRNSVIETVGSTPIFSKAEFEARGGRLDEGTLEPYMGSGPYMPGEFEVNQFINYVRNENFWGVDHPMNIGQNNFDVLRYDYFADASAAFEGFKAGEYLFRQENSSLQWATSYDFPAIENEWVVRETPPNNTVPTATGFVFNLKSGKFADPRVRQAIALMYNFTWTNETLQYGLFAQRESFWQNSALAATGVPEGRELEILESVADLIDPSILTDEVTMPHTSGSSQLDRGNLRRALALMEEAGWTSGENGMLVKDGQTFDLEILGYSPTFDRIILPYVDNLQRLGVNASWNRVDPAQYTERTRNFDFDMHYSFYRVGELEGDGLVQKFGSDGLGDVFNRAHYSDPAVDAIIEIVRAADTYDEMAAGVRAMDRIMRRDLFIIPAWYLNTYWLAYYDVYEHPEELPRLGLGVASVWWMNQDKYDALRAEGAFR